MRALEGWGVEYAGAALTVVKVAKPKQDMRFDVPVIGVATIEAMEAAGATCLCVEAGRTLVFDREAMFAAADAAGIAVVGSRSDNARAADNPVTRRTCGPRKMAIGADFCI